jgi:NAD(P)-dependent dehydrogenase (short-subunit alcohol dehydrogenase family)
VYGDVVAPKSERPNVLFKKTDVAAYSSILDLFDLALETYRRVDVAISNAGLVKRGNIFDPSTDLLSVREAPHMSVVDVNPTGTIYFSRIASVYLRQNANPGDDKSLILLSSVAGFYDSPGLYVYQSTKHGVIGLMRSLRSAAPSTLGFRINCVCPWATDTAMIAPFIAAWTKAGLPLNTAADVAKTIICLGTDGASNGKSVYVEGGRGWDVKEGITRLAPQWLGQAQYDGLEEGREFLGSGTARKS